MEPKTLFEKVWQQHVVVEPKGEPTVLYIDLQLVHEVTSPQAFEGLRLAGRKVRRPDRTVATVDHNVPTTIEGRLHILDQVAATQIATLRKNCADFGVELYDVQSPNQGIVHIIGPELGLTKPGMTIVCGDSHTSTHGAFGALAFGIGTSEVEHVMATQTLPQDKPKTFRINVEGTLPIGVTAKDIVLHIIGQIGTAGATGHVIEYAGSSIRNLHGRSHDHLQHAHRSHRHHPNGKLGHLTRHGHRRQIDRSPARPHRLRSRSEGLRTRPRVYGPQSRYAYRADQDRPRLHRLLHQRPHRRPPRRSLG